MTQGLISVTHNDEVVMKIVVGCNGYHFKKVVKQLKGEWPVSLERAYEIALENDFGSENCLVVMDGNSEIFKGDEDHSPLYRETFADPNFNPRWECGLTDKFEILKV